MKIKFLYQPLNIVISGSREYPKENYILIYKELKRLKMLYGVDKFRVVHGGARGVDTYAHLIAKRLGFKIKVVYPDWKKYGKKAGYIRNLLMVKVAHYVIVFWDGKSKGAKHTIDIAKREHVNKSICISRPALTLSKILDVIYSKQNKNWIDSFACPYDAYTKLNTKFKKYIWRKMNRLPNVLDL